MLRYRLRTLVWLTILAPPLLWGLDRFFKLPGTLYGSAIFVLALLICLPMIVFRLFLAIRLR